ncbi:hypothetical protein [Flavobacterium lindanitolerans]|uniref:Uncharacterized protein n=1 Tax=Flavobacterium lindanitolerans TaxID=428988 RepID=A0A497V7K6_9FLAO|nr:hypothetical protein [Flavobacterium lindanitolerans]MBC8645356.1 hypothetical protein [Flavobacterium lindanitolerans]PKW29635.1 hypothetical protein B0G92_1278 [Flavobacterium lindanitolerans]RLJ34864.1 hypothetical protein CLV50_0226 [Flavobacterium lindanitolerans]
MYKHKLIFRTTTPPKSIEVSKEELTSIIKDDSTVFEYFGKMVERPLDYEYYAELGNLIDEISFIMFYFDTDNEIIYSETEPKKYATNLLNLPNIRILSDGKDIDVFLELE